MIGRTFASLLVFASCSSVLATNTSGIHASLDISILEQAKDHYMSQILHDLGNVELRDMYNIDGKTYLKGNHLTVNQDPSNVSLTTDTANNALVLTMNKCSASFFTDKFHVPKGIFVAWGHAEVKMNSVNIQLGLSFGTHTNPDGKIVPSVKAVDVLVDVDSNDIDVKIKGIRWSGFEDAFTAYFKSSIVNYIEGTVKNYLDDKVPYYVNLRAAFSDGVIKAPGFDEHWQLDWSTYEAPAIMDTYAQLGARGIMFDTEIGESEWSTSFVDMPYKVMNEAAPFQAYFSDLTIDSMMGSFLEVGQVAGWVYGDQLPNTTLTASMLDIALPGFSEKYGKDAIVDIHGNCTDLHDFKSSAATKDVTVKGTANLQLWPRFNGTTELAVEMNVQDTVFTGGIDVDGHLATVKVSAFLVDKIEVVSSTIGRISAYKLEHEFNAASNELIPALNKFIQENYQIPIPGQILGVFTLNDIFLEYENGYIYAGATPTFDGRAVVPTLESVSEVALRLEQI